MKEMNVRKMKQAGFTLLEVVIAIAIVALLAAAILPGLLQNREDAKYSTALTQLQKDFPSAITRQVSRGNTCTSTNITKANLTSRGLPANTPWNDAWTVSVAGNLVSVVYPVTNAAAPATAGADLVTALSNTNNVNSAAFATPNVTVTYRCN